MVGKQDDTNLHYKPSSVKHELPIQGKKLDDLREIYNVDIGI